MSTMKHIDNLAARALSGDPAAMAQFEDVDIALLDRWVILKEAENERRAAEAAEEAQRLREEEKRIRGVERIARSLGGGINR